MPHIDPESSRPASGDPLPEPPKWMRRKLWPETREQKLALGGLAIIGALFALFVSMYSRSHDCTDDASVALVRSIQARDSRWFADENIAYNLSLGAASRVAIWIANGPDSVGIHSGDVLQASPGEGNLAPGCRLAIWNALGPVIQRRDQWTRDRVANSLR